MNAWAEFLMNVLLRTKPTPKTHFDLFAKHIRNIMKNPIDICSFIVVDTRNCFTTG